MTELPPSLRSGLRSAPVRQAGVASNVFTAACQALYGPLYQTEAARQLTISLSSVLRYANGERVVPREVYETLSRLIDRRLDELSGLRPRVRRAGEDK